MNTKERLVVKEMSEALKKDDVIILFGVKGVGKTTALLQLSAKYDNTKYLVNSNIEEIKEYLIDNSLYLLIIDEAEDYGKLLSYLKYAYFNCKIVIASSSNEKSDFKTIKMPVVTYLEYLYLTDRVDSYSVDIFEYDYGNSFYEYMQCKKFYHLSINKGYALLAHLVDKYRKFMFDCDSICNDENSKILKQLTENNQIVYIPPTLDNKNGSISIVNPLIYYSEYNGTFESSIESYLYGAFNAKRYPMIHNPDYKINIEDDYATITLKSKQLIKAPYSMLATLLDRGNSL